MAYDPVLDSPIEIALSEDLYGRSHDIALCRFRSSDSGYCGGKTDLVVSGVRLFNRVFNRVDENVIDWAFKKAMQSNLGPRW